MKETIGQELTSPTIEKGIVEEVVENQVTYSKLERIKIIFIIAFSDIFCPLASTTIFPSLNAIQQEFETTPALVDASISCFMAFLAISPLFWGGLSDRFGRKKVYIMSFIIFILGNVGCALSANMNFLIGMRAFQGIGSSASLVAGVGIITDVFQRWERGSVLSYLIVGSLFGPLIGPILGGYIDQYLGWRANFWLLAILCTCLLIIIAFFLPETLPKSRRQPFPLQVEWRSFKVAFVKESCFNPLKSLTLLKYPLVLLTSLCIGLAFATFFAVESSHSRIISTLYGLDPSHTGLTFIPLEFGNIIGNMVGGKISDWTYKRYCTLNTNTVPSPEVRLTVLSFSALVSCFGHLLYGWSIVYELPLYAPLVGGVLIGSGTFMTVIACSAYLIDNFPTMASTVTGTYVCIQFISPSIFTTFNYTLLETIGYGVTLSIYAGLCLLIVIALGILNIKGGKLRSSTGPF